MGCNQTKVVGPKSDTNKQASINRGKVKIIPGSDSLKKNYTIGKKIGEGNFGRIYEAYNTADPSVHVAIKVLDKKKMDR